VRTRPSAVASILCAAAFLALAVLVAADITQSLDVAARDYFRPSDEWTPAQARADILVEGLQPRVVATLLVLAGLAASLRRRSVAPLATAVMVGVVGGLAALATKVALGRPDPSGVRSTLGGSFPSGHVLSVLVCLGGAVLVLSARPPWWTWALVALATAGMGYGLLIQSAHWLTDVTGGVLLGLSVLAAACTRGGGVGARESRDADRLT
jgi:membrane-associated phospholipid phosphatase